MLGAQTPSQGWEEGQAPMSPHGHSPAGVVRLTENWAFLSEPLGDRPRPCHLLKAAITSVSDEPRPLPPWRWELTPDRHEAATGPLPCSSGHGGPAGCVDPRPCSRLGSEGANPAWFGGSMRRPPLCAKPSSAIHRATCPAMTGMAHAPVPQNHKYPTRIGDPTSRVSPARPHPRIASRAPTASDLPRSVTQLAETGAHRGPGSPSPGLPCPRP